MTRDFVCTLSVVLPTVSLHGYLEHIISEQIISAGSAVHHKLTPWLKPLPMYSTGGLSSEAPATAEPYQARSAACEALRRQATTTKAMQPRRFHIGHLLTGARRKVLAALLTVASPVPAFGCQYCHQASKESDDRREADTCCLNQARRQPHGEVKLSA